MWMDKFVGVAPPSGDYIKPLPKKPGTVGLSTLGSIIAAIITGQLLPYKNNRGNGRISKKTSDSAYKGVDGDSLGECTIGILNGEMIMVDFHSRADGFLRRWVDGKMTIKELKTPISVRVSGDPLSSYRNLNAGDNHKTKDKIKNPDLVYGVLLGDIAKMVGEDGMSLVGQNRWTVLSCSIYNLAKGEPTWNWPDVYQSRQIAMKCANDEAGTLTVEDSRLSRLASAILYWAEMMGDLKNAAKPSGLKVSKIIQSAGFFGFVICDRMLDEPEFVDKRVMVRRILSNLQKLDKLNELCRGNRDDVVIYTTELKRIFRRAA